MSRLPDMPPTPSVVASLLRCAACHLHALAFMTPMCSVPLESACLPSPTPGADKATLELHHLHELAHAFNSAAIYYALQDKG